MTVNRASRIDRIVARVRPEHSFVTLRALKDADGQPVVVRCERPDPYDIASVMRGYGGPRPERLKAEGEEAEAERRFAEISRAMIERWTALEREDGTFQTPAFSFADPPVTGALDGSMLTWGDQVALGQEIAYLGGYLGGPAPGSFLGDGGGGAAGDGTGAAGAPAPIAERNGSGAPVGVGG